MKKRQIVIGLGILALVFCINACSKKSDNSNDNAQVNQNLKTGNDEMAVPGYALGEIPLISLPEMPNLSVTENPAAKITLDMTKKISSVPGITITPVRVEDSNIIGGNYSMQIGKNGEGEFHDENKVVQTDGNGAGQYADRKNKITFQVDSDGLGMYKDENSEISIIVNEEDTIYNSPNLVIENNSDGSGKYFDKSKNLLIENNGKGKATITYNGKTVEVDAKPVGKPARFSKLKMVPAVPSIEANSLLVTLDSGVLFDVDKYNLRPKAEEILKNLAVVLKEANIKSFEVDGHTDSDASDEHNKVLSENRANSVKVFLASQGVNANIVTHGYGESKPIASNDTPEGKQKNRRVEIIIPTI
ncbi:outer membrane porin F [Leptotrichia trevisanii]|uniref:OmpA family protein n=1 Tax=Leptotrichia trevisanii TaxID=109328 RepID=UPI00118C3FEF|nr:OmpA family protein [Leptotrichia trevisanii]BBM57335.1 outer membrane porin F [Leptotrichia trevisanii]